MASPTAKRLPEDVTVRGQLAGARALLKKGRIPTAWLDAEVLLGHVLGTRREHLLAHPEDGLTPAQRRRYEGLLRRRLRHEPVAYLTGTREFYGLELAVSPSVLIPRPETELVVQLAVDWLHGHPTLRRVIDLGTGSGAIAVAIAKTVDSARVVAIDRDRRALASARKNVERHRLLTRVRLMRSDLLTNAPTADLIVANLPYLRRGARRQKELDFEPAVALYGGPDGLDLIRRTIAQAPAVLRSGGCLLLECDPGQPAKIRALAQANWPQARVEVHKDLAGHDRVVAIQLP
jgi:release factor glutamine methyltransferase